MDIKAKMHSQDVYYCDDVDLVAEQTQCLEVLYDFNHTRPSEGDKRQQIMKQL
ncbi:maltose acetyltransferase domain-containing protein, partial [Vibrio coralliirubri]